MVEEDYQAWEAYPQYRWIYNKLELALELGYEAGPACVPVKKTGDYIVRPVYNLYGMGIGAVKKHFDRYKDAEDLINHEHIPPGYFWCEWFDGLYQRGQRVGGFSCYGRQARKHRQFNKVY